MEFKLSCETHHKDIVSICFEEECPFKLACSTCLSISSCTKSILLEDIESENIFRILNSPKFEGNLDLSELNTLESAISRKDPIEYIETQFTLLIDKMVSELNKIKEECISRFKKDLNEEQIRKDLVNSISLEGLKEAIKLNNHKILAEELDKSLLSTDFDKVTKEVAESLGKYDELIKFTACLENIENIAEKAVEEVSNVFYSQKVINQVKELHSPKMAIVIPEKSQTVFSDWISSDEGFIYVSEVLKPNTGIYSLKVQVSGASCEKNISVGANYSSVFNSCWSKSAFLNTSSHVTGSEESYWASDTLTS